MPPLTTRSLLSMFVLGAGAAAQAAAPAWWVEQAVLVPGAQSDDYAVANIGQLKHIASKAAALMDARLPEGMGTDISTLVAGWSPSGSNPQRDDFALLNQGQLKTVAKKFYDRLNALGYRATNLPEGRLYPWTYDIANDDDNYAVVNLGQLKYVFSFILINLKDPAVSAADTDGDGISNADEAALGLLSTNRDRDNDGIFDGWEIAYGQNALSGDNALLDPDGDNLVNRMEFVLKRKPNLDDQDTSAKVAAEGGQFYFQTANGALKAWGLNTRGQLGIAASAGVTQATSVSFPSAAVIVETASGRAHGLAVAKTGSLYSWGDNEFGQLGDGTRSGRAQAQQISDPNLTRIIQVAAGDVHSLALRGDGTVWAWGGNQRGQLGDGSTIARLSPVQIAGLTDIVQITAGARHSVALDGAGRIWLWGDNSYGQMVDSSLPISASPRLLTAPVSFKQVAAGRHHVAAIDSNGQPWLWGLNDAGQLGQGNRIGASSPQAIASITSAKTIVAGGRHTMILTSAGQILGWGAGEKGQLGLGAADLADHLSPVSIAAGLTPPLLRLAAGQAQSVALESGGAIKAWGQNKVGPTSGILGVGSSADVVSSPTTVVFAP